MVLLASLVLGMGLPATASYIVLAVMTGPALQELGLALITAHMIIFWLAQSSNVTPPIALAAFAGAGVAGAAPMAIDAIVPVEPAPPRDASGARRHAHLVLPVIE